jgi:hypothetical protein
MLHLFFIFSLLFPVAALAADATSDRTASPAHSAQASSPQTDGAEIYLYPGSEADISAYGRCAHVHNTTSDTITAFAVSHASWPESRTITNARGDILVKLTPCKP